MLLSEYLGPEYFSRKGIIPIIPTRDKTILYDAAKLKL
jgi:hypothetical protein